MSEFPFVLLGMPLQNNSSTLRQVLESILNLDYPKNRIRLLFVNGGSRDGSKELLEQFENCNHESFGEVRIVNGDFASLPKSRNYCIKALQKGEYLFFLDSDVLLTRDALRLLFGMTNQFDICSLYYTHDRRIDPPQSRGISSVRAVRTGCTLFTPNAVSVVGFFNEKLVGEIEDADYCLRAIGLGLRVGLDEIHEQKHLTFGRAYPWYHPIVRTILRRKSIAWWFSNQTFQRRWIAYFILFGFLIAMPLSIFFGVPILAFFLFQLVRGSRPLQAFSTTIVALILPPTSIYAFFELNLSRAVPDRTEVH